MLDNLFSSTARVKLLNIFLLNPDNKYYIRQLARDLDLQVNAVRRELENLDKIGLIKLDEDSSKTRKNARDIKYYISNPDFIFFDELKKIFSKSRLFSAETFFIDLQKLYTPKLLILSGLFVSDFQASIDVLIVAPKKQKDKIITLIEDLEKKISHELNYTYFSESEFTYRQQVMDRFLGDYLKRKKNILVNNGILKI